MVRTPSRVSIVLSLALLLATVLAGATPRAIVAQAAADTYVYHQITQQPEGSAGVGFPVLSADGGTAVFTDAPGTGDPATPNRILTVDAAGGEITEVDSYASLCFCGSIVDISADGATVVSSDYVQVRIADGSGSRELIVLASNEITHLVVSGDGETVFFVVRRDTGTADGATQLPRGIWAIDANGDNLRQLASAEDIAALMDLTIEETGCCFNGNGRVLDASDDGGQVVFASYAGDGEYIFAMDGDGGDLRALDGPSAYVQRVAVNGDGAMAAFDVIRPDAAATVEVAVVPFGGGTPKVVATGVGAGFDDLLQLSADGTKLLINPEGLLVDTATGATRLLATSINGAGGHHEAVLTDGLARATMNAEADRFLYAMRTANCADCTNLQDQLATLDLAPAALGDAPEITDVTIEPDMIALSGASTATITATVTTGTVIGVGFAALLDSGIVDENIARGAVLLDDGLNGDARAGDDTYTNAAIAHATVVTREDDTGPRTVRIAAEITTSDGLRHATAIDSGTITVED